MKRANILTIVVQATEKMQQYYPVPGTPKDFEESEISRDIKTYAVFIITFDRKDKAIKATVKFG